MKSPLVSVIVPARNAEKTIGNAMASVLEQTMPDLELIVIDDASTDRTAAIVAATRDARICLLRSERNIRCAAASNLGLRNARGKWAAFLDADDEWTPQRLEFVLSGAQGREDCYVADLESLAVPGPSGRLVPVGSPTQPEDGAIAPLDLGTALRLGQDVRPLIPVSAFACGAVAFPEWGSCGAWTHLLCQLALSDLQGRYIRRVGYLYRACAAHDSSTSLAREEAISVFQALAADTALPEPIRELLRGKLKDLREALVAGALRERRPTEFLCYAARYPSALTTLPRRAFLFGVARARVLFAQAALHRPEATQRVPFQAGNGPREH